ncbi:hypothetical protein OAM91_04475 [Gammaproteobacteria bacterium]|nr:hypothetical protein [Gammaproteobacteria bacterium]
MDGWLIIILIICAVLNTILFFKIWAMTNNIEHFTFFYMHEKGIALDRKRRDVKGHFIDKEGKEIQMHY